LLQLQTFQLRSKHNLFHCKLAVFIVLFHCLRLIENWSDERTMFTVNFFIALNLISTLTFFEVLRVMTCTYWVCSSIHLLLDTPERYIILLCCFHGTVTHTFWCVNCSMWSKIQLFKLFKLSISSLLSTVFRWFYNVTGNCCNR